MNRETRVTIGLEPKRWKGSPLVTWYAAIVAWGWFGLLLLIALTVPR